MSNRAVWMQAWLGSSLPDAPAAATPAVPERRLGRQAARGLGSLLGWAAGIPGRPGPGCHQDQPRGIQRRSRARLSSSRPAGPWPAESGRPVYNLRRVGRHTARRVDARSSAPACAAEHAARSRPCVVARDGDVVRSGRRDPGPAGATCPSRDATTPRPNTGEQGAQSPPNS